MESQKTLDYIGELKTAKGRVQEILRKYPHTRDSDWWLLIRYLQEWHPELKLFINYQELKNVPMSETIRRVRQKIQNEEGLYVPSCAVDDARKEKEETYRNEIWEV